MVIISVSETSVYKRHTSVSVVKLLKCSFMVY